jgi:PAS domain S-box-containing protein
MIMVIVASAAVLIALLTLYRVALEQQRERLVETAQSQARLIEAMDRYHMHDDGEIVTGEVSEATLNQVRDAHERFKGFGETGEFTLAMLEGDQIVFVLSHRHFDLDNPEPVPFYGELAEPMRLALSEKSGTIIGLDYRGETVLAAYEPVEGLGLGIVAKIDMTEMRRPFINAALLTGGVALGLIILGVVMFQRITGPLLRHLEENETKFRNLFEHANDSIFIIDPSTRRFLDANENATRRLGYTHDELLEMRAEDVSLSRDAAPVEARMSVLQEHKSIVFEMTLQDKLGSKIPVEISSRLIEYGDQQVVQSLVRDISERKEIERMKDAFVSNVSHELRTPITGLKLFLRLLEASPSERREEYRHSLRRETERLSLIIEDLLRLSRLDQDHVGINPTPTELNSLTKQHVADRTPLAESRRLTLSLEVQPDLPTIQADERLVGQTLSVLLTNALNYTPEGGAITIRTCSHELNGQTWVGFCVSDDGPGVDPDEQERLFERFFRGRVGRESDAPGTGLGLAIAKEIVDRHGGRIEVVSEGVPGKGTSFTVWLPAEGKHHQVQPEQGSRQLQSLRASSAPSQSARLPSRCRRE